MKIIDLSYEISNSLNTYPTDPSVKIDVFKDFSCCSSKVTNLSIGSHTGTHVDSPAHIIDGGKSLSDLPLDHFFGKCICVDLDQLEDFLNNDFEIDGLIVDTSWAINFDSAEKYYGKGRPELPLDILEKIVSKNNLKFFGVDLPSVDVSGSKIKKVHLLLLERDIVIYENLKCLPELPRKKVFDFVGLPLNLKDGDGCPVRAIAKV